MSDFDTGDAGDTGTDIQVEYTDGSSADVTDANNDGYADQLQVDSNGDGATDTWEYDSDGDGKIDQVDWDANGDGTPDHGEMDTNADGRVDTWSVDTNGDGTPDQMAVDSNADGRVDAVGVDTNNDGTIDSVATDTNYDGQVDAVATDSDGDGTFDTVHYTTDGSTNPFATGACRPGRTATTEAHRTAVRLRRPCGSAPRRTADVVRSDQEPSIELPPWSASQAATNDWFSRQLGVLIAGRMSSHIDRNEPRSCSAPAGRARKQKCRWAAPSPHLLTCTRATSGSERMARSIRTVSSPSSAASRFGRSPRSRCIRGSR